MDEYQATIEVLLPPKPFQQAPQKNRVVTIAGSVGGDGRHEVDIHSGGEPTTIKADLNSLVTIGVVEVLVNGRESPPASIQFAPIDYIEPIAADPAAFTIRVVSVEKVQVAEQTVVAGPAAVAASSSPPTAAS